MSAFPHAEKFITVNQILAKGGAITTLDRATISAFMATLVHEIAEKEDALQHFAAENQRLVDAQQRALQVLEQKIRTESSEDDENIDDCSPIPRCRQEAAEWAKNTDEYGKPLPLKDSTSGSSDGLQPRFFMRGSDSEEDVEEDEVEFRIDWDSEDDEDGEEEEIVNSVDEKEKERQAEVMKEFIRIKRLS